MGVVTLGYDGSPESEAAAAWAAEKSVREDHALHVVYAWEWSPYSLALTDAKTERRWVEGLPRQAASKLAKRYRGLTVTGERIAGPRRKLSSLTPGTARWWCSAQGPSAARTVFWWGPSPSPWPRAATGRWRSSGRRLIPRTAARRVSPRHRSPSAAK